MKRAYLQFRLWVVHGIMEGMVLISRAYQMGHPYGGAPRLRPAPSSQETIGSFEGGRVYSFDHGIVVGNRDGVAISSRNEYFSNLTHYFRGPRLHPAVVRLRVPPVRKLAGTGAYLCTVAARGNYYHWMIDLVPRLWLLEQAGFTARSLDHVFVNGNGTSWEAEPLLGLGFRPDQIRTCAENDRFQVNRLIVPDRIYDDVNFVPWKARFLRRLFPPSPGRGNRRLFCGRKDTKWRRLLNEDELFARLEPLGFERLETAGMSVSQQARHFSEAQIVVAVHGATLANIVFAPPTALLIDIQSRESPQTYFSSICAVTGVGSRIVFAQPIRPGLNNVDRNRVDMTLSSGDLEGIVRQVKERLASTPAVHAS